MKTILLVDDDPLIHMLFHDALDQDGYQIESLYDGRGVLSYLEQHKVDLLVFDIMMPQMDGFELLREFDLKQPGVVVAALSSSSMYLDMVQSMGVEHTIQKPLESVALRTTIQHLVDPL